MSGDPTGTMVFVEFEEDVEFSDSSSREEDEESYDDDEQGYSGYMQHSSSVNLIGLTLSPDSEFGAREVQSGEVLLPGDEVHLVVLWVDNFDSRISNDWVVLGATKDMAQATAIAEDAEEGDFPAWVDLGNFKILSVEILSFILRAE